MESQSMPDNREYMHGVSLIKVGTQFLVIFSSNNYPPTSPPGNWTHDVYYSWLTPTNPTLNVQTLFGITEAQEPASAAMNSLGRILVTCEDGSDGINQLAGLWTNTLTNVVPYPNIFVRTGGHSGHVTEFGDRFLITYSEGWQTGGGFEGLGTGMDIWVRFADNAGALGPEISIATGRNWWPTIASSGTEALVVWQRYISDASLPSLQAAIVSSTGTVVKFSQLMGLTDYYNYEVRFMPDLNQYLVIGSNAQGAYAVLVDKAGNVTYTKTAIAQRSMREGRFAVNGTTAVYPMEPSGVCVLDVSPTNITVRETITGSFNWDYTGTDGIFLDDDRALFAGNTTTGLKLLVASGLDQVGPDPDPEGDPILNPFPVPDPAMVGSWQITTPSGFPHQSSYLTAPFTVHMVFKTPSTLGTNRCVFSKDGVMYGDGGDLSFWIWNNFFRMRLQSTTQSNYLDTPIIEADTQYLLTGTGGPGGARLYLDGVLILQKPSLTIGLEDNTMPVGVGGQIGGVEPRGQSSVISNPFNGPVTAWLLNKQQTASEVMEVYNALTDGPEPEPADPTFPVITDSTGKKWNVQKGWVLVPQA